MTGVQTCALPICSAFLASITGGAVDGVIYRNDLNTAIAAGAVTKAPGDFNDAYEYTSGSDKYAVGVSGKFKGVVKVAIDATTHVVSATVTTPST